MKILFVMYDLGSAYSATSNILVRIASQWAQQGVECHFLGPCEEGDSPKDIYPAIGHSFRVYTLPPTPEERVIPLYYAKNTNIGKMDVWRAFVSSPLFVLRQWHQYKLDQKSGKLLEAYTTQIKALLGQQQFDAVIGVYFPYQILQAFSMMDIKIPLFLYQLDPWTLHESEYSYSKIQRWRQETKAFQKATHIFTTPALLSQYRKNVFFRYIKKMTALDFPGLTRQEKASKPFVLDKSALHIVFTGSIADDYRSPEFILHVFERVLQMGVPLTLYFIGNQYSHYLNQYIPQQEGTIQRLPACSPEEADQWINSADFLLNIGNTFTNQVPSKLITYISTGKPIISTKKAGDLVTAPYLDRYPAALQLEETQDIEEAAKEVAVFLGEYKGNLVPRETIDTLYEQNRPEYVAGKMLEVVKQAL